MIRASSILFWFALTIVTSLALYGTSNRVQDLGKQLRTINTQIEAEQANIHVLKAEWVYLASPARIEMAARKYLAMNPTALKQIAKVENIPELLPTQKEAMAGGTVEGKPLANIGATLAMRSPAPSAPAPKTAAVAAPEDTTHIKTHIAIQPSASAEPASGASLDETPAEGPILLADINARPHTGAPQ